MAIAIVEDLWGRIRAHIDDKITAAEAAAERAEAAAQSAETGVQADTVGRVHLTPELRGEIDGKSALGHTHTVEEVNGLDSALAGKATKADVTAAVAALVDGAPEALDTLKEIAEELKNNETARAALANQLTGKAALSLVEARPVTWLWDGVGTWRPPAAARPGDSVLNLVTSAITQAVVP